MDFQPPPSTSNPPPVRNLSDPAGPPARTRTRIHSRLLISSRKIDQPPYEHELEHDDEGNNALVSISHLSSYLITYLLDKMSLSTGKQLVVKEQEFVLEDLPEDIIVKVLSRLPAKSVCYFKCASNKSLLNLIDSRFFRVCMFNLGVVEVPRLMLLTRIGNTSNVTRKIWSVEYNSDDDRLRETKNTFVVPDQGADLFFLEFVFCNLFGFTRGVRYSSPCFVINPLRGEVLDLPPHPLPASNGDPKPPEIIHRYGMGYDTLTNTHKIVHVTMSQDSDFEAAQIYVLGKSSEWRDIDSVPHCLLSSKNVSAHGNMYWLIERQGEGSCGDHRLLCFDFKKENFEWTPHPNLVGLKGSFSDVHLVTIRGCLAIVDLSSFSMNKFFIEIWVMKDYDRKSWALEHKIKAPMLVRGPPFYGTCVSCRGEWEHGIFFREKGKGDRAYYFLDLRSGCVKQAKCDIPKFGCETFRICSYTDSMISLRSNDARQTSSER